MTGSLVSPATRQRVRDLATPIARGLGRLGLTPNALTLTGFPRTSLAPGAAALQGSPAAALLGLGFGIIDLFDGTLARATGQTSRLGSFLDSTFDRSGEAIVFLGITAGFLALDFALGAFLAACAMAGAFMVSYTRAKSESLGFTPGTGMAEIGLAPREVRIGILTAGLLAAGLFPGEQIYCVTAPCPQPLGNGIFILVGALGLIAALAAITVIQRIVHVSAQAREG